jgi:hypothetical protein
MEATARAIVRDGLILIGIASGLCLMVGMIVCWIGG